MTCHKKGSQKNGYFIDPLKCPKIVQMEGLETTVLTGLHGEKMMMLSATLPGHSVPPHSHSHEQIGIVYAGKAILKLETRSDWLRRETSPVFRPVHSTATPPRREVVVTKEVLTRMRTVIGDVHVRRWILGYKRQARENRLLQPYLDYQELRVLSQTLKRLANHRTR